MDSKYPERDFRYKIIYDKDNAVDAVSLEPLPELLRYWNEKGDTEDFEIYNQGIKKNIINNRYPLFILDVVIPFPEFHSTVIEGLLTLWLKLKYTLTIKNDEIKSLNIDINGIPIELSENIKINILLARYNELKIKTDVEFIIPIIKSYNANLLMEKFHMFNSMV